jgi:hypothetical protein
MVIFFQKIFVLFIEAYEFNKTCVMGILRWCKDLRLLCFSHDGGLYLHCRTNDVESILNFYNYNVKDCREAITKKTIKFTP